MDPYGQRIILLYDTSRMHDRIQHMIYNICMCVMRQVSLLYYLFVFLPIIILYCNRV